MLIFILGWILCLGWPWSSKNLINYTRGRLLLLLAVLWWLFDSSLECPDCFCTVGKVLKGLPGAFLESVALPFNEVVHFSAGPAPLQDVFDLPLGRFSHKVSIWGTIVMVHISTHHYESHITQNHQRIFSFSANELIFSINSCFWLAKDSIWLLICS